MRTPPFAMLLAALLPLACAKEEAKMARKDEGKTPGGSAVGGKTAGDSGDGAEGGEEEGGEEEGGEGAEGDDAAAIEQLLSDCGGKEATEADPDATIYEKTLRSEPIVKQVLIITATIATELKIKVTGAKQEQDAKVTVTKLEGAFAELARPLAEKQAADSSGKSTLYNVPFSEYVNLSKDKAWDGVLCTFVPVTKVENHRGGKTTVATFDPPMPSSVSPKAIAERYAAEIGARRVFTGMKINVLQSDHPDLAGRTEITGTVTVTKVAAGEAFAGGADIAYKVQYDFGGPKATFALGFAPEVTYYISTKKHDLNANIVDTTAAGGGRAVFIHN